MPGEIVVDLFAGIGYWTLQLLKRSKASFVHGINFLSFSNLQIGVKIQPLKQLMSVIIR